MICLHLKNDHDNEFQEGDVYSTGYNDLMFMVPGMTKSQLLKA